GTAPTGRHFTRRPRATWTCSPGRRMLCVMAVGIELERVQRKSGGRIHLTPHVPDSGPAVTLWNPTLCGGTSPATDQADACRNCLRGRDDPARVSSAFFQSDVGAELLQRSLEEARTRRATRPTPEHAPALSAATQTRAAPPGPAPAAPAPAAAAPAAPATSA